MKVKITHKTRNDYVVEFFDDNGDRQILDSANIVPVKSVAQGVNGGFDLRGCGFLIGSHPLNYINADSIAGLEDFLEHEYEIYLQAHAHDNEYCCPY